MERKLLILFLLCWSALAGAQTQVTSIQGRVIDASTGEAIPFVQVTFVGSTIGTTTDMDGRFTLSNDAGYTHVSFRMMGYEPTERELTPGQRQRRVKVRLTPHIQTLDEVEVKASRSARRRYRRRNNPAVDLVRKVIEHREQNRLENNARYSRHMYERFTLSLDDFSPDPLENPILRLYPFLERYIGETPFDASPILTISIRETTGLQSYRQSPHQQRTLLTARRIEGIDRLLGEEGLDANIDAMFVPVDIYDGDIALMLNHFVSPLSPTLAVAFYRYYITDTVVVEGQRCVELSFVPASSQTYGFTGRMYVALDSSYALTKYVLSVSPHVVINFVQGLSVVQTFSRHTDGRWLPARCDTYLRWYVSNRLQKVYAHQVRYYSHYDLSDNAPLLPDSLFDAMSDIAWVPLRERMLQGGEALQRPLPLSPEEAAFDTMRDELERRTGFRVMKELAEIAISNYVPTAKERSDSRFDLGPVFNLVSHNQAEGWRLRIGGMTTARLHPRHFAEGYLAYGFTDHRAKFNATYTYTFNDKYHHSHEAPHSLLSLAASYELEAPGQAFDQFDRDNILMSNGITDKVQYVLQASARLRKEWINGIGLETRLDGHLDEPEGALEYQQYQADGTLKQIDKVGVAEWTASLMYSPGKASDNRRWGNSNGLRLTWTAPNIHLAHKVGFMEGGFRYQRTDLVVEKRFWLASFGHLDLRLHGGMMWSRAPFPRLYFPNGNASRFLSLVSFNTMQPMEFIVDRYAALLLTYHLKGLIINHLPLVQKLGWREVAGFNILCGALSDRNNPQVGDPTGLYRLPDGTTPLGSTPYMEYSLGIENIFRCLRIDYVRRLTYVDGWSSKERGFIRLEIRFTL